MFDKPQNYEEKPYNLCVQCVHIGKRCDGPNFLAMSIERWCEWARLRKEYLNWTNALLAEVAGVSKVSVDRITAGNVKDIRITTMQAVTKALVNGTWGQYPCALAALEEHPDVDSAMLLSECEHLRHELNEAQEHSKFLKEQIAFKEKQMEIKDEQLHERFKFLKRKDLAIAILGVFVASFVVLLMLDMFNGHFGYFRY